MPHAMYHRVPCSQKLAAVPTNQDLPEYRTNWPRVRWCARVVPLRPRACGGSGAGFGVQEREQKYSGGARARASGHLYHRTGERICVQLPSGGCKPSRKASSSYFKYMAVRSTSAGFYTFEIVRSVYEMRTGDGPSYLAVSSAT